MKFNTPLRYSGGNDNLSSFLKIILEQNDLLGEHYVEPYAGSAGIALNLLTHGYVSCIHLNDINPAIYAFWHSVLNQPDELCKAIYDVEVTAKEWQRQKDILNSPENHNLLELGFSIFFLNRINRLGILWGGVIDRKSQNRPWNFDARFNKADLIRRIEWIALHRSLIRLYNKNVTNLIETVLPTLPDKTVIYLDFPCHVEKRRHYRDDNLNNDPMNISKLIKERITQHWIVSCHNNSRIIELYKGYPAIINNSNARNLPESGVSMFFSKRLVVPNWKNPSNLMTA